MIIIIIITTTVRKICMHHIEDEKYFPIVLINFRFCLKNLLSNKIVLSLVKDLFLLCDELKWWRWWFSLNNLLVVLKYGCTITLFMILKCFSTVLCFNASFLYSVFSIRERTTELGWEKSRKKQTLTSVLVVFGWKCNKRQRYA